VVEPCGGEFGRCRFHGRSPIEFNRDERGVIVARPAGCGRRERPSSLLPKSRRRRRRCGAASAFVPERIRNTMILPRHGDPRVLGSEEKRDGLYYLRARPDGPEGKKTSIRA